MISQAVKISLVLCLSSSLDGRGSGLLVLAGKGPMALPLAQQGWSLPFTIERFLSEFISGRARPSAAEPVDEGSDDIIIPTGSEEIIIPEGELNFGGGGGMAMPLSDSMSPMLVEFTFKF